MSRKKIMLIGSVTVYVMLMLGFVIGFYMMGYTSPVIHFAEQAAGGGGITSGNFNIGSFLNTLKDQILSPFGIGVLGIAVFFSVIAAFSGSSGVSSTSFISILIPFFLLFAVANIFFFPIVGYVQAEGIAGFTEISLLLAIIFNVLLMLTVIEFISGRN